MNTDTQKLYIGTIIGLSSIHGDRMIDVSLQDRQDFIRVALDWEHLNIETNSLTDAAYPHIEATVKRKGGYDAVEWDNR